MPVREAAPAWVERARSELGELVDHRLDARSSHSWDAWPLGIKRARLGHAPPLPAAVASPRDTPEVSRVLAWAAAHGVEVVPWGGGSSVTGAPVPHDGALSLDLRGLNRILDVDRRSLRV